MAKILSQKNILITGGTSELGQAFVLKALEAGANVFFTFHKNEERAKELTQQGAYGFQLDLSDMRAIDGFAKQIKSQISSLDCLIHNAAAIKDKTIQNLEDEDWDLVLTVNLKAPYYLTKKLLSLLFKKNESNEAKKIFMMTSRVARRGGFGVSNYAAAKAGLIALSQSLAQELGRKNILVNAVNPGFMKSAMTKDLPEPVIDRNLSQSPLQKWSNPAEVADFLVYLASPQMTQVTGQVFHFESRQIPLV